MCNRDFDKKHRLGAIEIKYIHKGFPCNGKTMNQQIKSHIFEFKKLLYTTGLKWRYYEYIGNQICIKWTVELGNYDDKTQTITWNGADRWEELKEKLLDEYTFY